MDDISQYSRLSHKTIQSFQQTYKNHPISPILIHNSPHQHHQQHNHQEVMLGSSKFIVYLSNNPKEKSDKISNKAQEGVRPQTTYTQSLSSLRNPTNRKQEFFDKKLKQLQFNVLNSGSSRRADCNRRNKYNNNDLNMVQRKQNSAQKKKDCINYIALNKENISKINSATRSINFNKKYSSDENADTMKNGWRNNKSKELLSQAIPLQSLSPSKFEGLERSLIQNKVSKISSSRVMEKAEPETPLMNKKNLSGSPSGKNKRTQNIVSPQHKNQAQSQPQPVKLTHSQIKQLFGQIHRFYEPQKDYLRTFIEKGQEPVSIKDEGINKALIQVNDQCQVQISPTKLQNKIDDTSQFYVFESERADIVTYLKKVETKKIYPLMIKQNRQNSGERFRDQQFPPYYLSNSSQSNLQYISKHKVYWTYCMPQTKTVLYNDTQSNRNLPLLKSSSNNVKINVVSFLCCLMHSDPQILKKLFQPPIHNVFCVWLFSDGVYEPIYIDGYFPLNEFMEHFYGQLRVGLWLPIIIKCICKVLNSYQVQHINSKISTQTMYEMLTGLQLQSIDVCETENQEELIKFLQRRLAKNFTCIVQNTQKKTHKIIKQVKSNGKVVLYDPCFGIKQTLKMFDLLNSGKVVLHIVPPNENRFVYANRFQHAGLSKFELQCSKKTQVYFIATELGQQKQFEKEKSLYIYECSYNKTKKRQMTLTLKAEANIERSFKYNFKRGTYKIFFQAGQHKIQEFFEQEAGKQINWNGKKKEEQSRQFIITLLGSQELKVNECQCLKKKGSCVEDQKSLYYEPIKKDRQESS